MPLGGMANPNTWNRVLGKIESKVSPQSYRTWFRATEFVAEDANSLTVRVPNLWFADWLQSNYLSLIQDVLREVDRAELRVDFRAEDDGGSGWSGPSVGSAIAPSTVVAGTRRTASSVKTESTAADRGRIPRRAPLG